MSLAECSTTGRIDQRTKGRPLVYFRKWSPTVIVGFRHICWPQSPSSLKVSRQSAMSGMWLGCVLIVSDAICECHLDCVDENRLWILDVKCASHSLTCLHVYRFLSITSAWNPTCLKVVEWPSQIDPPTNSFVNSDIRNGTSKNQFNTPRLATGCSSGHNGPRRVVERSETWRWERWSINVPQHVPRDVSAAWTVLTIPSKHYQYQLDERY